MPAHNQPVSCLCVCVLLLFFARGNDVAACSSSETRWSPKLSWIFCVSLWSCGSAGAKITTFSGLREKCVPVAKTLQGALSAQVGLRSSSPTLWWVVSKFHWLHLETVKKKTAKPWLFFFFWLRRRVWLVPGSRRRLQGTSLGPAETHHTSRALTPVAPLVSVAPFSNGLTRPLCLQGSCVNLNTLDRVSPLHGACVQGHAGCAELLVENGANVSDSDQTLVSLRPCQVVQGQ